MPCLATLSRLRVRGVEEGSRGARPCFDKAAVELILQDVWPPIPEDNYRKSHLITAEWVDKAGSSS